MEGRAEDLVCADPGASTHIGVSKLSYHWFLLPFSLNLHQFRSNDAHVANINLIRISGRQAAPHSSCSLRSHQCGGSCQVEVALTLFLIQTYKHIYKTQLYIYRCLFCTLFCLIFGAFKKNLRRLFLILPLCDNIQIFL
jgi:hypothetical protein